MAATLATAKALMALRDDNWVLATSKSEVCIVTTRYRCAKVTRLQRFGSRLALP